jgi:biotin carboxylase
MVDTTRRPERLLLLFPAQSYRVEAFVRAAERAGVELWLGTDRPAQFGGYGRPVITINLRTPDASAAGIALAAGKHPFAGIVATDEGSAVVAAMAAKLLGLPHAGADGAIAARNKRLMRALLDRGAVPGPRWQTIAPDAAPEAIAGELRFPCVVKPPMLSGSQGVIRADTPAELARAVHRIRRILGKHSSDARADPAFFHLLVEDYLPGAEVAVEAIMTAGELEPLAIFDKPDDLAGPFFEETIYVTPSRLPAAAAAEVLNVTARAARALGLDHGPIHAELRVDQGRARVVEIAARSIGGLCSRVFQLAAGPLEDVLIAHAAGRPLPAREREDQAAGVMMMPIARSGVLRRVSGIEEARRVPGVEGVTVSIQPNMPVRALPEGASYLGFVFARGPTPEAVEASLRASFSALRFEWKLLLDMA